MTTSRQYLDQRENLNKISEPSIKKWNEESFATNLKIKKKQYLEDKIIILIPIIVTEEQKLMNSKSEGK